MTNWRWLEDGKTVEITTDGREILRFEGATVKEKEWREFDDKIGFDVAVFSILETAKRSFISGNASYVDARNNLRNLLSEMGPLSNDILRTAKDIDVFFNPPKIVEAFKTDRKGLIEFVQDFIARMYVRRIDA